MCECMCACVSVYACVCVYVCVCMRMHVCVHVCMSMMSFNVHAHVHVHLGNHTCSKHVSTCARIQMYLSFAIGEFRLSAETTLEHLKWENLILVQERTNAGGGHFLYVAMINKINFDIQ